MSSPNAIFSHVSALQTGGTWSCGPHSSTGLTWDNAGRTSYSAYGIIFDSDGNGMIDVEDATFAQSDTVTLDNGSVLNNVIIVGKAGDCYAAGMCDNNKQGSFSVDLTDTGLAMPNTFDWGYPSGWVYPSPNTMVCLFFTTPTY